LVRDNSTGNDSGEGMQYNFLEKKDQSMYKSMQKTLRKVDIDSADPSGFLSVGENQS